MVETQQAGWTNLSVLKLAGDSDPMALITKRSKDLVLEAVQAGWTGPPFDPFGLAKHLGIPTVAKDDVLDARVVVSGAQMQIEFNPNQSRRRIRFSVAHEIGHTLFPDCLEIARNRGKALQASGDDWQLEMLCDVAAAEILMPTGHYLDSTAPITAESMLRLQSQFDVSMEALAIRLARVSRSPFTIVVAARTNDDEKSPVYRVDYTQPSRTSQVQIPRGLEIASQILSQCTAVGYTAKGSERISEDLPDIYWECIGIPPYPGRKFPRVIGIASLRNPDAVEAPGLAIVRGDALEPRGQGPRIIAQVVNDRTPNWGAGFAKAVADRYPSVQADFKAWASKDPGNLSLGRTHASEVSSDLCIYSMVAQHGFGPSPLPRIRYAALRDCLEQLSEHAQGHGLSIHIPRIGTGYAGGNWSYIAELLDETIVRRGIRTTVYVRPGSDASEDTGLACSASRFLKDLPDERALR
jgi:Zn-dependent peptidase ImmA (M78 family)/O-acetyl-ADP-ribose deacetylase (regulator of RNase III)